MASTIQLSDAVNRVQPSATVAVTTKATELKRAGVDVDAENEDGATALLGTWRWCAAC